MTWNYDGEGNRIRQEQYGLYGQLRADRSGVAIYNWTYDRYGNILEESYGGIDGQAVENNGGIALSRWEYDGDGMPLAAVKLDRNHEPHE